MFYIQLKIDKPGNVYHERVILVAEMNVLNTD